MKLFMKLVLAAALAAMPLTAASANLITNGSFEEPDLPFGTWAVFASIPGWTTTFGPGIEIQDHAAGSPFDGGQLVELDSYGNSGMIQTVIATTAGQTYDFSFAYSPRPGVSAESNTIQVYFNSGLLDTLSASGIGLPDTSWTVFGYSVTATGTSSSLEFRAAGTSETLGGYLDAVSFDARVVPEPASLLLLGSGLAGLGALAHRRNRRK